MTETTKKKLPKIKKPGNRWIPRKWRPEYEIIVSLSASGMSHEAVADRFFELSGTRYTTQHISNIVNTPEAKVLQEHIVNTIRTGTIESFDERVSRLQNRALDRVEKMLDSDELFEKAPFAVVDRSMSFLRNVGKSGEGDSKNSSGGMNINSAIILTEDAARILREGTDKANEVKRLYGN